MYKAFDWEPPAFAHLPLLLNKDKSKLSKRNMDVDVQSYLVVEPLISSYSQDKGFLPEALMNFMVVLGRESDPLQSLQIIDPQTAIKNVKIP